MTIDAHVHCGECFRQIETTVKIAGGKTKDAKIGSGTQFVVVPRPDGMNIVPRMVPLCPDCHETINKQAKAASKLIVPSMNPPKIRPIQ